MIDHQDICRTRIGKPCATITIRRGVMAHQGRELNLKRRGVIAAMVEFLLAKPDRAATLREILEDQHGSCSRTWNPEIFNARVEAGRVLMARARKLLEQTFGPGWLVKTRDRPPRYILRSPGP